MINKDEYIKVGYIDFLTVSTNNEDGIWYEIDGYKVIESIDGLVYLEVVLESGTSVKIIMNITDYALLEEDILK